MTVLENIFWIVLGGVITLPLAIFANLFTDSVKNWLAKRSKRAAEKRIKQLERHLVFLTDLSKSSAKLTRYVFKMLTEVIFWVVIYLGLMAMTAIYVIGFSDDLAPQMYIRMLLGTDTSQMNSVDSLASYTFRNFVSLQRSVVPIPITMMALVLAIIMLFLPFASYICMAVALEKILRLKRTLRSINDYQVTKSSIESEIQKLRDVTNRFSPY